jgi:hypothetical protein
MVKYYGRARQRTGAVNTKQMGLKMAGCAPTVGKKGTHITLEKRRAPCGGSKFSCGLSGKGYTCRYALNGHTAVPSALSKYCVQRGFKGGNCVTPARPYAGQAGGVGNIWTPRS